MPTFARDEDEFWKQSAAAAEIFAYLQSNDLGPWGFDKGWISDNRQTTGAEFSCVALTGLGKDTLFIAASFIDGAWQLSHKIVRAK